MSNEPIHRMRTQSEMFTDARTDSVTSRESINSDALEQSRLNIAAVCREMWGDEETDLRQNVFAQFVSYRDENLSEICGSNRSTNENLMLFTDETANNLR